jgi:hypothetical protein
MPAFPGAETISVTRGDLPNAQTIACSRPPPPITNTFIEKTLLSKKKALQRDSAVEISYDKKLQMKKTPAR